MSLCNIPSTISDPSYRYQMPRLVSTKEGSGNGVKTSLLNINEVSAALKVPPTYTTKFFGCEVCAISKYSNNESEGVRATVNGIHTNDDLQTLLDKFIEMFVLCPKCHLPETTMRVGKSKLIGATCAACGFSGDLEGANMHKLQTFILSHPPGEEGEDGGKSKKKGDKAARRAEKVARQQRTEAGDGAEDDEDEGKEKKPKKEKKEKKEKKSKRDDDDEDADEDGGKKSKKDKKEKKERKEKKSKKDKKKASDSDSNSEAEKDDGDEATVLNEAVAKFKSADLDDHDSLLEELRLTQLSNGWDSSYRMLLLLEAISADNEGKLTGASVQAHGDLVQKVVKDARLNTNLVCRALENFAERSAAACKGQLPLVVKYLYDEDLVDESDLIAKYAGKERDSFLAQELSPLIAWLQESDDDSSSGSDSD